VSEPDDVPAIEFLGTAPRSGAAAAEDLLDVGRERRPSRLGRAGHWPLTVAACAVVVCAGAFALAHRPGPPSTQAGAAPASNSPSSSTFPLLHVDVPDTNSPFTCTIGTAHGWSDTGPVTVQPEPGTVHSCDGTAIFRITFHDSTARIQHAITHYLPSARVIGTTTMARIGAPGQRGIVSSRSVVAQLAGHRITIRVRAVPQAHQPAATAVPAGVLYRYVAEVPGFEVDIQVTGRRGWVVPKAALVRLARDPRLVQIS
jgi:hypothetical protein